MERVESRVARLEAMSKRVWGPTARVEYVPEEGFVEVISGCGCGKGCPDSTAFFCWNDRALDTLAWTLMGLLADKELQ